MLKSLRSPFIALTLGIAALCWADVTFSISYPKEVFVGPFTGRAVVYLSKQSNEPMFGPNWFGPEPCYSAFFQKVQPGEAMILSNSYGSELGGLAPGVVGSGFAGFPGKLSELPAGDWKVQVVLDRNLGGRAIGRSAGNLYSVTKTVTIGTEGLRDEGTEGRGDKGTRGLGILAKAQRGWNLEDFGFPTTTREENTQPYWCTSPMWERLLGDGRREALCAELERTRTYRPSVGEVQSAFPQEVRWSDTSERIGNLRFEISKSGNQNQVIQIVCDQVVTERKFNERANVKEAKIQSKLLSAFYGRPTFIAAAVILPEAYVAETERKFPVIYEIPGFGGNHYIGARSSRTLRDGEPFINVVLDPDCPTGHCVFADSANNGPWGAALTTELIPYIESTFRAIGKPEARFVTGHSSGGWSSLWLQVAYPEFFGGVWSTSPDPVDFRDFQMINLYKPGTNMFTDESGNPRPIARIGDKPFVFYKPFSDMERPIRGEQLGSFEGVFSPKGSDGEPMKLWNRDTGAIDTKVAEAWKKYDITLILKNNWKTLGPKLAGKIHVYMGDMDTFYLEGATKLLQAELRTLGSDAVVEIVPGDHGSMMTADLRARIDREMAAQFRKTKVSFRAKSRNVLSRYTVRAPQL